jgi:hypothetical protein
MRTLHEDAVKKEAAKVVEAEKNVVASEKRKSDFHEAINHSTDLTDNL